MSDGLEALDKTAVMGGSVGYWRSVFGQLRRNRGGMAGMCFVLVMVLVWIF